jgi:hypothetical protein
MKDATSSLIAHVTALLPEDWRGVPGELFRKGVEFVKTRREPLEQLKELGGRKLVGMANQEFTAAEKNLADAAKSFAEREDKEIDTALKRRTLESAVSKSEADALKARADARKTNAEAALIEVNVASARFDFEKKVADAGMGVLIDESGNLRFIPLTSETKELSAS